MKTSLNAERRRGPRGPASPGAPSVLRGPASPARCQGRAVKRFVPRWTGTAGTAGTQLVQLDAPPRGHGAKMAVLLERHGLHRRREAPRTEVPSGLPRLPVVIFDASNVGLSCQTHSVAAGKHEVPMVARAARCPAVDVDVGLEPSTTPLEVSVPTNGYHRESSRKTAYRESQARVTRHRAKRDPA